MQLGWSLNVPNGRATQWSQLHQSECTRAVGHRYAPPTHSNHASQPHPHMRGTIGASTSHGVVSGKIAVQNPTVHLPTKNTHHHHPFAICSAIPCSPTRCRQRSEWTGLSTVNQLTFQGLARMRLSWCTRNCSDQCGCCDVWDGAVGSAMGVLSARAMQMAGLLRGGLGNLLGRRLLRRCCKW